MSAYTLYDRLQMSCSFAFLAVLVWFVPEYIANRLLGGLNGRGVSRS